MGLAVKNSDQKIPRIPARLYNETFYKFLRHFFLQSDRKVNTQVMVIWVVEFLREGYKTKQLLAQKSTYSKEIIVSFELTFQRAVKIGHYFLLPSYYINKIYSFEYVDFLVKNLSNFVSLPWKLSNPYHHNLSSGWSSPI